ncbi:MAG: type II toxin-antitoxin system Phd/YefM family antitoxin [Patescibacteria group bacterium]
MQIFNIHEAKTNLSKLIEKTQNGEEVIIAKAGEPVVKLVPHKEKPKRSGFGALRGKIFIPDNFDDEDEEINEMFYGKSVETLKK